MDLVSKCQKCLHRLHSHDIGGAEVKACRYCNCQLGVGEPFRKLPLRKPSDFKPKPASCASCPIYGDGLGYQEPSGQGKEGILVLVAGISDEEERSGPSAGAASKQLQRMVARIKDPETGMALDVERDCRKDSIIRCKLPFGELDGQDYEHAALSHCRQYWTAEAKTFAPKAILALGNQPLRATTGQWGIKKLRGYVQHSSLGKTIGTYSPDFLLRGQQSLARVWQLDFLKSLFTARGRTYDLGEKPKFTLFPSGTDLETYYNGWVAAGRPLLVWDLETPYASAMKDEEIMYDGDEDDDPTQDASYTILRISFCYDGKHSITMPWAQPFIGWSKRLLEEAPISGGWNSDSFDIPRVENYEIILGGLHVDGMLLWHYLEPALPMGLGYVVPLHFPDADAWKLESSTQPELYSAKDSWYEWRLIALLIERAKREGHWAIFLEQFVELGKVLRKMSRRGILTDSEVRKAGREMFQAEFTQLISDLQPLVPQAILPKKVFKASEEKLKKSNKWVEGKMVEVVVEEEYKEPKARKVAFRVFYTKQLKKGPVEKSKIVKAFTADEAISLVPGALHASPVGDGDVREAAD